MTGVKCEIAPLIVLFGQPQNHRCGKLIPRHAATGRTTGSKIVKLMNQPGTAKTLQRQRPDLERHSDRKELCGPHECLGLLRMMRNGSPVSEIEELAEQIAASYTERPAHDSRAEVHHRQIADLLAEAVKAYRRETAARTVLTTRGTGRANQV